LEEISTRAAICGGRVRYALLIAAAMSAGVALAQSYPARPIKMIVPFPAGGGYDLVARTVAQKYTETWGQPVVIDNHPGANGNIGTELAAKSPPDGYTLIMGGIGPHALSVGLYPKLPYDPIKDFEPITLAATQQNLFVAHPSVPVKTVSDLVRLAKSRRGQLTYASTGSGSGQHLAAEQLKQMAGIDLVHVPYKCGPPALSAIMAGEVSVEFNIILLPLPHVKAGRLTALGVASSKRSQLAPEIQTLAEAGYPIDIDTWYGLYAPAGIPKDLVAKLNAEAVKALSPNEVKERLRSQGIDVVAAGPDRLAAHNKAEIARWSKLIREAKITID
jgi:tripartite-type tricarboxylate transporter receptor subunit TctC